jgi:outer membrane protein TolC
MKHPVVLFLILSAALGSVTFSAPSLLLAESPVWTPPPLNDLIAEGLRNNKELQGMGATLEGLRHEIAYAGSLDDPQIGLGLLNLPTDTFDFNQEPMTQKQILISQKVPWFGKLDLKSRNQALKALRQEALIDVRRLELARKIAVAYYELGFVIESLASNERLANLVAQLLRVAETKYTTGEGLQQNVLQAQVEQSTLLDEKIMLEEKKRLLEDSINEFLNRESFTPVAAPERPALPEFDLHLEALQQQSLQGNPWLGVRQAELARAEVEIELAKKEFWPNMDFNGYVQYSALAEKQTAAQAGGNPQGIRGGEKVIRQSGSHPAPSCGRAGHGDTHQPGKLQALYRCPAFPGGTVGPLLAGRV